MSVYVDDGAISYGQMIMCHMLADSREELDQMADKISVNRKWIQNPGTYREHYDICKSKKRIAVQNGAIQITWRELAAKLKERRNGKMPI